MHHAAHLFFALHLAPVRSYWRTEHIRYDYPTPPQARVPMFLPNTAELFLFSEKRAFLSECPQAQL